MQHPERSTAKAGTVPRKSQVEWMIGRDWLMHENRHMHCTICKRNYKFNKLSNGFLDIKINQNYALSQSLVQIENVLYLFYSAGKLYYSYFFNFQPPLFMPDYFPKYIFSVHSSWKNTILTNWQ